MKRTARWAKISKPSEKYQVGRLLRTPTLHIVDEWKRWKSHHETCERENINQAQDQLQFHNVVCTVSYKKQWRVSIDLALILLGFKIAVTPMQYGNQWFITLFTRTHCMYLAYTRSIQPTQFCPISLMCILILSSLLCLGTGHSTFLWQRATPVIVG